MATKKIEKEIINIIKNPVYLKKEFSNKKKELFSLLEISKGVKENRDFLIIKKEFNNINLAIKKIEKEIIYKKKNKNCYMEISSSIGGADSAFCVDLLLKQYKNFSKIENLNLELLKEKRNNSGVRKYVLIKITGKYSFGMLEREHGINKFIRNSKTKKKEIKQTCFCNVKIIPEILKDKIEINKKDIKIETFKSSGAGGQHVNKTNSAVRIRHIKTGISVKVSSRRSQFYNKIEAFKILIFKINKFKYKKENRLIFCQNFYIRKYFMDKFFVINCKSNKKINMKLVINGHINI